MCNVCAFLISCTLVKSIKYKVQGVCAHICIYYIHIHHIHVQSWYMLIIHYVYIERWICLCGQLMSKGSYLTDLHSLCRGGHLKAILPRREPPPDQRWAPNLIVTCRRHHSGPEDNGCSMQNKRQTKTTTRRHY